MDLTEPASVVMSAGTVAVLRVLAGAEAPFTGRQVARLAGVSHNQVARIIDRLAAHGLVTVEPYGSANLVRLNRDHLAARAVIDLVQLRDRLTALAQSAIAAWPQPPLHASIFGSAARGDGGTTSDLDILVIRDDHVEADEPSWTDQLFETANQLRAASGNAVSWFELGPADLRRAIRAAEPIVDDWRHDSVTLYGPPARSLLKELR